MKTPPTFGQFSGDAFCVQRFAPFRRARIEQSFQSSSARSRWLPFGLLTFGNFFFERGDDEPAAAIVGVGQGAENLQRHLHAY